VKRSTIGDASRVSRWFAGAALLLAGAAAPSSAHAAGFGGGAADLGIVLQPRGDRMAFRADGCRRVVRGSVKLGVQRFGGRGAAAGRRWRLRGRLRNQLASGTLRIAGCGTRRFRASAFTGVTPNAPRPRKGGAYGGMSQFSAGDGMLAPLTLRVSGDGQRVGGRFTLTGSCRGVPEALAVGPLRIRRNHTFGGSRSFGRRGRLSIFGRIARHSAVGVVRIRSGRCDTGKRRWGAGLLRFIPSDEPPSPVAYSLGDDPTTVWPVAGAWSLDMVSDPGNENHPSDYIGLGRRYSIRSPRGTLLLSGGIDFLASYWVEIPGASYWSGDFSTPRGTPVLRPGTYHNARRWPFHDAAPGMDISGDHRGCNDLGGRFTIHELARAPDGFLSALHVTFEQHCEFEEAAIRGEFRFRAS